MNGLIVCAILAGILYFCIYNWAFIYLYFGVISIYFILSWVRIPASAKRFNGPRKKIQISTWSDPSRPTIIAYFKVRLTKTLPFLERVSQKTGQKITLIHLLTKSIATAFKDHQDFNQKIVFGNFSQLKSLSASKVVSFDNDEDVYFIDIKDIDQKSLTTIANEMQSKEESLIQGTDNKKYKESCAIFGKIPTCLGGVALEIIGFLTSALGFSLPSLGLKAYPFGNFIVSDMSMLKTEVIYAPLIPMTRNPFSFTLTHVHDEVIAENSDIHIEKVVNICCSLDHRFADGIRLIKVQNIIQKYMENPDEFIVVE